MIPNDFTKTTLPLRKKVAMSQMRTVNPGPLGSRISQPVDTVEGAEPTDRTIVEIPSEKTHFGLNLNSAHGVLAQANGVM